MLEAAKRVTTSALIPFVPRQVMLDTKFNKASQKEDKERRKEKEKEMEKEKKKKSKKMKSSQALEDGSGAPETLTLDRANGGELPQKGKSREIFLRSIAAFLQTNGFDKTLSVFRSETQLENDGSTASFINLEDLFCKYLASSEGYADAIVNWPEEKGLENGGACRNDESGNIYDVSEHIHKKKRKHKNETDDGTKTEISEHGLENVSIKCTPVKSVEKDMNRSAPEGCSAENNEVIGNKNRNELNSLGDTKDLKKLKSAENSHVESKGKKRKKKSVSDSLEENANKVHLEVSHETAKNTDDDNLLPKTNVNDKTKRKKKHKVSSDACDENTDCDHRKFQEIVKEEREELKSLTNNSSTLPAKTIAIHKAGKKMKTKAMSDSLAGNGREEYVEEALRKSDSGNENAAVSEENVDNIEKKAHKKRKKLASAEKTSQTENETITEESKHVKLDENNRETGALQKLDKSLPDTENATTGKKRKTDSEENPSAQDILKEFRGHQLANGNLVKNEKEGGTSSKSMKKEKHSTEPKTVNAFQRVKIDEVKFADDRLQDNSYWALDGTGSGYGAKAQEVLGQVRGRDFRHEKTKKKRGTYRGGQIDLQAHSIKFNYSDEE